ncbi:sulfotransferase [Jannaschia sp. Os4]|uniref:sulfotransferase n=1 Tax=Jannaschia sp. Os4 TaxID=2807617 RepID=UPI00193A76FC|nr:sulfotransferase [Jannaschia sp. Os4]MBM2577382.1 sulfotransferase [Jannaschia sp. Os4]
MADPTPFQRAAAALADGAPDAALEWLDRAAPSAPATLLRARALAETGDAAGAAALAEPLLDGAAPALWAEAAPLLALAGRAGGLPRKAKDALPAAAAQVVADLATGRGSAARGGLSPKDRARLAKAAPSDVEAALAGRPGGVPALLLGRARAARGDRRGAAEALAAGVKAEPFALDLRLAFAEALRAAGHPHALREARMAVAVAPLSVAARLLRGDLALAAGRSEEALAQADRAVRLAPREARARRLAVRAALALGDPAALNHARAVGDGGAAEARALIRLGRDEAAAALLAGATDPGARVTAAQAMRTAGAEADAEARLRAVLEDEPGHAPAWHALAQGGHATAADVAAMEALPPSPPRDFALARALERTDPARAFAHLAAAKAAQAAAHPYDPAADRTAFERIVDRWAAVDVASGSAFDPILVTGLPRSGTTLVEAILSAHPGVRAGGELAVLGPALQPVETALDHGVLPEGALDAAAARYARRVEALRPGAGRVTDKSIHSFASIGAILKVLPRARIVVVHRDPRDVGLSMWRNAFPDGTHRYAATQAGIAHHAKLFRDAVDHWRGALPEGAFHELSYEELLADPEGVSRALLDACGLDWDPAVLRFHEAAGRVQTLSFDQVRRPLYATSKGGWRRHAAHLTEMLDEMARLGVAGAD